MSVFPETSYYYDGGDGNKGLGVLETTDTGLQESLSKPSIVVHAFLYCTAKYSLGDSGRRIINLRLAWTT